VVERQARGGDVGLQLTVNLPNEATGPARGDQAEGPNLHRPLVDQVAIAFARIAALGDGIDHFSGRIWRDEQIETAHIETQILQIVEFGGFSDLYVSSRRLIAPPELAL
jgi:hypothetical protein